MASRDLEVRVRADVGAYQKAMSAAVASTDQLSQAGLHLQKLGLSISNLGDTLTKNVTLPLALIGGAALKLSSDFDKSFTTMQTLAGVTSGEVEGLKESVLDLAGETGRAPQELAEALYFLQSSGLDSARAMDALEMSAKASAVGLGDTATVADAVSSAMLAYSKSGLTAAEATDVLVATARAGKAEPAELANQMGRLLPVASELGITFDQVGASIALLSRQGNSAEQSTTLLVNVMTKLLKPSEQAKQQLDAVGLSLDDLHSMIAEEGLQQTLENLREILGDNGFAKFMDDQQAVLGALSLTNASAKDVEEVMSALQDSAGATQNAFSTWAESMGAQNAQAFAQFQVALIQLGDVIAPIASQILGFVSQLVSLFSELPQPVQTAVVAFAALAAATGPFLSISGRLITEFGTMTRLLSDFAVPAGAVSGAFNNSAVAAGGLMTRLSPLAAGVSILGPLAIGAGIAFQAWSDTKTEAARISDDLTEALKREAEGMEGAADAALAAELTTGDLGSKLREAEADLGLFNDAIRESGDALEQLDDDAGFIAEAGLAEGLERAGLAGSDFADELLRLSENMSTGEILDLIARLDGLSDRYDEASESASETAATEQFLQDQHASSSETIKGLTVEIEGATSALQAYADALKAMFDPQFAMIDAMQSSAAAQVELRDATAALAEARAGGDVEAIVEAENRYNEAVNGARSSVIDLEAAAIQLKDSMEEQGLTADQVTAKFVDLAVQQGFTQAEALEMAAAFGIATGQADTLGATDPNVAVSETGNMSVQEQLRSTSDAARGIPPTVHVGVFAETHSARLSIAGVGAALNDIDGRVATVTVKQLFTTVGQMFGFAGGRAAGGPVDGSMPYLVGEEGPELFMPAMNGRILSHADSMRWLSMRRLASGGPVRLGSVSSEIWNQLKAAGWRGDPTDAMEALYPPEELAQRPIRQGSVSSDIWEHLKSIGYRGQPGDNMEALYSPAARWGDSSVTVVNYHLAFNGPTNDVQVVEALKRYERSNGAGWRN